jgi:hypothetical protein
MRRLMTCLTTVAVALMLGLTTVGCQPKEKVTENKKALDVQVDVGKTQVKVEGNKNPDDKGGQVDVDVVRHPGHEPEAGAADK